MSRVVVIGVGNAFRSDDGAGLRAVELARPLLPPDVPVIESDGEPARLIDCWRGAEVAIVVDASRSDAEPGFVRRAEAGRDPLPDPLSGGSTHALGIGEAVALAEALGRRPERVIVFAIEGASFDAGEGLTAAVEAGAAVAAERLVEEVAVCV